MPKHLRFGLVVLLGVALATAASASFSSYVRPAVGTGGEGYGCVPPFHFCALALASCSPPPSLCFTLRLHFLMPPLSSAKDWRRAAGSTSAVWCASLIYYLLLIYF
jgi:hypothetical protein